MQSSKILRVIFLVLTVICSFEAIAASLYCSGKVNRTYVTASGDLVINSSWLNNYTRLCSLKGDVGSIDTVTCSMWASYAETALKDNKQVIIQYNSSDYSFSTLPTYNNSPAPGYFMIIDEPAS